jgi:hypothetical protein
MKTSPPGDVLLGLKDQEIPLGDLRSHFHFRKPFVSTQGALSTFGPLVLNTCLAELQAKADEYGGLDYLQVFQAPEGLPNLWFIEDEQVVTALLPEEY